MIDGALTLPLLNLTSSKESPVHVELVNDLPYKPLAHTTLRGDGTLGQWFLKVKAAPVDFGHLQLLLDPIGHAIHIYATVSVLTGPVACQKVHQRGRRGVVEDGEGG